MTDKEQIERIQDLEFKVETLADITKRLVIVIQNHAPISRINYIELRNLEQRLTKP